MKKWPIVLWFFTIIFGENVYPENVEPTSFPQTSMGGMGQLEDDQIVSSMETRRDNKPRGPMDHSYPVQHAGLPRKLAVYPVPLDGSEHELMLNVSWLPPVGPPAKDYSIEVLSVTNTIDCKTALCYEYNIPGFSKWWSIPSFKNSVADTCAVRPGCAYRVKLIAHPWDGHTSANMYVKLDECISGVCSCAHSPRLPSPSVNASLVWIQGDVFVNVSWMLPKPDQIQRLPSGLGKQYYFVSVGKQMVSNAHPSPWFAHTVSRKVDADGLVATGDGILWVLLPISERSDNRNQKSDNFNQRSDNFDQRSDNSNQHSDNIYQRSNKRGNKRMVDLDVKLLARVSVIDDRGCVGPAGNATAFDPVTERTVHVGTYIIWAALGGACVLTMVVILATSLRVVKKFLNKFRPTPVSVPLEPLSRRPAWFPLQLNIEYRGALVPQM